MRITFSQLRDEVNRIGKGLISLGIKKGDRVAILMENREEWPMIELALFKIGGIAVCCNTRLTPEDLKYILNKVGVKLLIMSSEFKEVKTSFAKILEEIAPELSLSNPEKLQLNNLPYLERVIILDSEHTGCLQFDTLLRRGEDISDETVRRMQSEVKPVDAANIIFTSGTTGLPKACISRHGSWITRVKVMGEVWDVKETDKVLLPSIGYFTTFTMALGLTFPLIFPLPVVIHKVFDEQKVLETIENEKITILLVVPTMLVKLFEHPRFQETDSFSLRTGCIGGAAGAPDILLRARSKKKGWGMNGHKTLSIYGLTETAGPVTSCTIHDKDNKAAYTVGRICPLVDFKIIDPVTKNDVGVDQVGELLLKGEGVMEDGYYGDPEETADALRNGWFHTKDLVTFDKDGYMKIVGRASEMMIVGGFNVYPKEIENIIMENEKVVDVSVFRITDKTYGEVPAAYIILKSNVSMTVDEIIKYCRDKMAKYKIPKYIKFVDEFPLNPSGKVQKLAQAEELSKELGLK